MPEQIAWERVVNGEITCPTCDEPFWFRYDPIEEILIAQCCAWEQRAEIATIELQGPATRLEG